MQTDIEITREEDFTRILQMEEEYIQQLCEDIIRLKPDVVITEKGISGRIRLCFQPALKVEDEVGFPVLAWTEWSGRDSWGTLGVWDETSSELRSAGFELNPSLLGLQI